MGVMSYVAAVMGLMPLHNAGYNSRLESTGFWSVGFESR